MVMLIKQRTPLPKMEKDELLKRMRMDSRLNKTCLKLLDLEQVLGSMRTILEASLVWEWAATSIRCK